MDIKSALMRAWQHPGRAISTVIAICRGQYYRFKYRLLGKKVIIGRGFRVFGRGLDIRGPGTVIFGEDCTIVTYKNAPTTPWTHSPDAVIRFGDRVRISSARLGCQKSIEVGYGAGLSETRIMDTDFHDVEVRSELHYDTKGTAKPVVIGANVWLCAESMVLKGVTIGENSVIGAAAIVYENVPANVIAIGNPARVVWNLKGRYSHSPSKEKQNLGQTKDQGNADRIVASSSISAKSSE